MGYHEGLGLGIRGYPALTYLIAIAIIDKTNNLDSHQSISLEKLRVEGWASEKACTFNW